MTDFEKVKYIASIVRNQCESFAFKNYSTMRYDFCYETLDCMCAFASMIMKKTCKKYDLQVDMAFGKYDGEYCFHCWNEFGDKIIDITATQFNTKLKPVYITSITNKKYDCIYLVDNYKDMKGWDESQFPSSYSIYNRQIKKCILKIQSLGMI